MSSAGQPTVVQSPELRHLKPLDGVRGLAIVMVMLTHGFESDLTTRGLAFRLLGTVLDSGKFGVDLFFVLSGFLITGILIDTRHDPHFFRSFFGRRALRILPLYYGLLLGLLFLSIPFHWRWQGMAIPLLTYTQNFKPYVLDSLFIGPGIGLFHFWSLAVEEQFYLIWPPLVYWLRGSRTGVFWAALLGACSVLLLRLALVLHGTPYLFVHVSLPTRADSLLIGALLAIAYRSSIAWARVLKLSAVVFLITFSALSLSLFLHMGESSRLWTMGLRYTCMAICCAALLSWSLKPRSSVGLFFEQRWLRLLGKYSYGLYVLHVVVLSLIRMPLRYALVRETGSKGLGVAVSGLVSIALSISAAYLSFELYEKRFLQLKRFFPYAAIEPARAESPYAMSENTLTSSR